MPEGDTVRRTADRLHQALAGAVLLGSDLRVPALATSDLRGRRVLESSSHGKHLLLRFGGEEQGRSGGAAPTAGAVVGGSDRLTLHTHLRMEGSWRLFRAGRRWGGGPQWQVRVVLATENWQAVGYRLPLVELLRTEDESLAIGHLGPDLLGPDPEGPPPLRRLETSGPATRSPLVTRPPWDEPAALQRLLADPGRPIVEALLDQRNVAGIGNMWALETCYLRGVDPWTPAGDVDLAALLRLARRMMQHSLANGARQITTGDPRPGYSHWVYGRSGAPCRRCRTPIRLRRATGRPYERKVYWCPTCQPGRSADAAPR